MEAYASRQYLEVNMFEHIAVGEIPRDERTEELVRQAAGLIFTEIEVKAMGGSTTDSFTREDYLKRARRERLFVAIDRTGDVIGAATLYIRHVNDSEQSELSNIAVAPDYRRHHIGNRLITSTEAAVKLDGIDAMVVIPLDSSLSFYVEQGYEKEYDGSYYYIKSLQ